MNLNIMAPINQLGYGIAGLNIIKALEAAGHKPCLWPILNNCEVTSTKDQEIIQRALARQDRYDPSLPCLRIWHQWSMAEHIGKGWLQCGFPFFELDGFSERELHHLNNLDIIFVTSQWAKDVLIQALEPYMLTFSRVCDLRSKRIKVVPLGVDRTIFHPNNLVSYSASFYSPENSNATIFMNIGKWELRKGHDILIEAFCQAFKPTDNVYLYMLCDNPFLSERQAKDWEELYTNSRMGSKIVFVSRMFTQVELASLMNLADCGVFPARAEGWNLEALEMLSCGKQVILTNYSGHTGYANSSNSTLIEPDGGLIPAYDGVFFKDVNSVGKWLRITSTMIDNLAKEMYKVHENKQGRGRGILPLNEAGITTAETFSWKRTAEILIEGIMN